MRPLLILALLLTAPSAIADDTRELTEHRMAELMKIQRISEARPYVSEELGPRVICGEDDRKDLYQLDPENPKEAAQLLLAQSTCLLTSDWRMDPGPKLWLSKYSKYCLGDAFPACPFEPFHDQRGGGWCTGFLAGPDLVVTAGHCIEDAEDLAETRFVFGFGLDEPAGLGDYFDLREEQVYSGKEIIAREVSDEKGDFAVIRLDRKVPQAVAKPLTVRRKGDIEEQTNVGVIGHPGGLPAKVAFGEGSYVSGKNSLFFWGSLDTYGGNSGSPVFGPEGMVEGILVSGGADYALTVSDCKICFCSRVEPAEECRETATKASAFVHALPSD